MAMVCNLNERSELSCFTAYSIILANDHNIPVTVPNTPLADVQFHAGQKMARFESISPNSPTQNTCANATNLMIDLSNLKLRCSNYKWFTPCPLPSLHNNSYHFLVF